jgi:hypothetical protein
MTPDQASQIVSLYGGDDESQPEPIDQEQGADLSPLAAARGDAMGSDDKGDGSPDAGGASTGGGMPDPAAMFSKNPRVQAADAKLDNIISQMTARQQALMDQHQQNGGAMPLLALASGLLSPTRTGGMSESIGNGIREAMPAIQQERQQDRLDQQGLFGLRLKAATLEQERARMEAARQYQNSILQQKRSDKFAEMGMRIGPDGSPILDPHLLDAATAKQRTINEAREGERFKDEAALADIRAKAHINAFKDAMGGPLGSPLSQDEIDKYQLPPGTVAVHGLQGPKIISKPANMVVTGFDENRNPIYSDKATMVTPAVKSGIESQLSLTKTLLGHYNWMIDQIESGKIGNDAFGIQGKTVSAAAKVAGNFTDKPIAPQDVNFRTAMGLTMEPTKNALSRDPGKRMSNQEAEDIEPYLPSDGFFENKNDALVKLKEIRNRLITNAQSKAQMLGSQDVYSPHIEEWAKTIQKADNFNPGPLFGSKGNVSHDTSSAPSTPHSAPNAKGDFTPVKVRKGSKMATVSSKDELNEALQEGWSQ